VDEFWAIISPLHLFHGGVSAGMGHLREKVCQSEGCVFVGGFAIVLPHKFVDGGDTPRNVFHCGRIIERQDRTGFFGRVQKQKLRWNFAIGWQELEWHLDRNAIGSRKFFIKCLETEERT